MLPKRFAEYGRCGGFSLVELSIVLVILGLLVGGILSGQSLIRASELRSLVSDYSKYYTAVNAFREKYFYLPGDMPNATGVWGYSGGTNCVNRTGTAVTGPGTCDGDGNGRIEFDVFGGGGESEELFQAWRQLALAGLVAGDYTGLAGTGSSNMPASNHDFGINAPASRISNVGWGISYLDNRTNNAQYYFVYVKDYVNWFTVGGDDGVMADDGFLTPGEAWNIDTKIDDGKPAQGAVQTRSNCTTDTDTTHFDSDYDTTQTGLDCMLLFKQEK